MILSVTKKQRSLNSRDKFQASIEVLFALSKSQFVIVIREKNQVDHVDMYKRPSTLKLPTFIYCDIVKKKSIR